ncbi:MAG: ATP phosphoribosyltransferase regulatory subunit, partial [Kurthia sp.]
QEGMNLMNIRQISKYLYEKEAFIYMEQLASILEIANTLDEVAFDFTLASHMNYYTGMLFEVYAANSGYSIGNGGRYDGLLAEFGEDVSAIGFALRIDQLLEAMPKEPHKVESTLVLYVATQLEQALQLTSQLRADGKRTTMQAIEGLHNIPSFEEQFTDVLRVGQGGGRDE